MAPPAPARPRRKRPGHYHHGDLRRALVQEALRVIQTHGADAVTLRGVGERLGVSRTALYRHFADKAALLGEVCLEGFRMLRLALLDAWEPGGTSDDGSNEGGAADAMRRFEAMGLAYVRFAVDHPSHYRVMFGGVATREPDPALAQEAGGAFQALVDAIVTLQRAGACRPDDPLQTARFIWSVVHGVAMLAIDGQLERQGANPGDVARFAIERLRTGIEPRAGGRSPHPGPAAPETSSR
jgi:AcrR family transcriptional regulator